MIRNGTEQWDLQGYVCLVMHYDHKWLLSDKQYAFNICPALSVKCKLLSFLYNGMGLRSTVWYMFGPACNALWSQIDCWMKSNTQSLFVQHWMLNANYCHSYKIALISMTLIWKNAAAHYDALWPHSIININKYWLAQIYMHPSYSV